MSLNDTIVACATAAGYSSIAVLRVSGPQAYKCLQKLFKTKIEGSDFLPNQAYFGSIVDPVVNEVVD